MYVSRAAGRRSVVEQTSVCKDRISPIFLHDKRHKVHLGCIVSLTVRPLATMFQSLAGVNLNSYLPL